MKITKLQKNPIQQQLAKSIKQDNNQVILNPYSRDLLNMQTSSINNISFGKKKIYTKNEKDFLKFRKEFSKELHKRRVDESEKTWNAYINKENKEWKLATKSEKDVNTTYNWMLATDAEKRLNELYRDKDDFEKLEKINKKGLIDKNLKRHMKTILEDFRENFTYKDDIDKLSKEQNDVDNKFNNHKFLFNGKETTKTKIDQLLKEEKNPGIRKELYLTSLDAANKNASDIINLVKNRNVFAKKQGYDNYYDLRLDKDYELKTKDLNKMVDDLLINIKPISKKMHAKRDAKVMNKFEIEAKDIKPWHYGLQDETSVEKIANQYIPTKENNLKFSTKMYEDMGWDMKKADIHYDLYPRDGKSTHGFAFDIDTPKDTRILANLSEKNLNSLNTINHEHGHCLYWKDIDENLPYIDKQECTAMLTEAVAMLFGDLHIREPEFMVKEMKMPVNIANKLNEERKEDLVNVVEDLAVRIKFENEMYKNPNQDLNKLHDNLNKEIMGKNPSGENNAVWAKTPHFRAYPAYCQNYLRAQLAAEQIHEAFSEQHGNMTYNTKTSEFFKNEMFNPGGSISEDEMLIKLTGKKLNADAFINSLSK